MKTQGQKNFASIRKQLRIITDDVNEIVGYPVQYYINLIIIMQLQPNILIADSNRYFLYFQWICSDKRAISSSFSSAFWLELSAGYLLFSIENKWYVTLILQLQNIQIIIYIYKDCGLDEYNARTCRKWNSTDLQWRKKRLLYLFWLLYLSIIRIFSSGSISSLQSNLTQDNHRVTLVFYIGGITHSELAAYRFLSHQEDC